MNFETTEKRLVFADKFISERLDSLKKRFKNLY
jgi:hypothetical protein